MAFSYSSKLYLCLLYVVSARHICFCSQHCSHITVFLLRQLDGSLHSLLFQIFSPQLVFNVDLTVNAWMLRNALTGNHNLKLSVAAVAAHYINNVYARAAAEGYQQQLHGTKFRAFTSSFFLSIHNNGMPLSSDATKRMPFIHPTLTAIGNCFDPSLSNL